MNALQWLHRAAALSLQLLLPPQCVICGLPTECAREGTDALHLPAVCSPCLAELPWNVPACAWCALPLPAADAPPGTAAAPAGACSACELRLPRWTSAIAPLRYAPPVSGLVLRLKRGGDLRLGRWLARQLVDAVDAAGAALPDAIACVPMHPSRARRQGFNHGALLADEVSRILRRPLLDGELVRHRRGARQAGLGAAARATNLAGAFRWTARAPAPGHVALVDDVLTTGATATAVATTLRRAGALRVDVWCCARTPHGTQLAKR